jgi:hypothetical protein
LLADEEEAKPAKGKTGKGKAKAADADDEVTIDTLKEKITQLVDKKGKDHVKALFKKAKIEKLPELAEKHYIKFNEVLDGELAEGDGDDLFGE